MDKKHICCKCNVELISKKVTFEYMKVHINHEVPACPVCGQIYLDEELVKGKIAEVEMSLEDK